MDEVATASAQRKWNVPQQLFASLPWYDLPELREATDAFWKAIAEGLAERAIVDVPATLNRTLPYGFDFNGKCLLTQVGGYQLLTTSRSHFHVLGTPCYNAPGCEGPLHRAFIVVHATSKFDKLEDLRDGSFAINELDSNSGMNLPRRLFAPLSRDGRFFERRIITGSQEANIQALRTGDADAASIDCISFALFKRYRPSDVAGLRIIAESATTLAPPFVTSSRADLALLFTLREVLLEVMRDFRYVAVREALLLDDLRLTNDDDYAVVLDYQHEAERMGYPSLL